MTIRLGIGHGAVAVQANLNPNTPTITAGTPQDTSCVLTSSAFSDDDVGDTHAQSRWQVTTAADTSFSSPVVDTTSGVYLTTYTATGLTAETDYICRVQHQDNHGAWSEWSATDSLTTAAAPATVDPLHFDDWETRNLSYTNGGTFAWGGLNRTSLVIGDGADDCYVVYNPPAVPPYTGPWAGKEWENGPGTGTCAMRFRYPANDNQSEQRWSMTTPLTELWFGFWWKVPINFYHGTVGSGSNQKLFALWMDAYEYIGTGPTWTSQFRRADTSGSSRLSCYHVPSENTGISSGESGQVSGSSNLITTPDDRGRWMNLLWYIKCATGSGQLDGIGRIYRKWEGESTYEKLWEDIAMDTYVPAGLTGFLRGYIMGWNNTLYAENTEFLMDYFKIWNTDPGLV